MSGVQIYEAWRGSTIAEAVEVENENALRVVPVTSQEGDTDSQITTALLLAAGAGSRLGNGAPKCLTEVSGEPILGRLVSCLVEEGFERLVVVVGYRGEEIREYLDFHADGLEIQYIECRRYATTNNIYSLWLAREHIQAPFVLIESDLVFEPKLLGLMRLSNRIAVARLLPYMNGTTVSIEDTGLVGSFSVGGLDGPRLSHKTVNIYSLSLPIWNEVVRRLDQRITAGRVHDYYETVFAEMAAEDLLSLRPVSFDDGRWIEIDTPNDLSAAHDLFNDAPLSKGA